MDIDRINPELRGTFKKLPAVPLHNRVILALARRLMALQSKPDTLFGISISEQCIGDNHVRIYRPAGAPSGAGLLWIHGGGYVIGAPQINDRECARYARDLRLVVVSVAYRLAPEHPFPCAHDDCFAGWRWFQEQAGTLGVDPGRIVVSGQSAGAGLAAGLVQRIHDVGGVQPAAQALFCPMLDDRTANRTELDAIKHRMWTNKNNRAAWRHYLGQPPGAPNPPPYAVPGRRENLAGLPDAWIGVGDIDLFQEENCEYARRLQEAGVACRLDIFPGAPHGFEILAPEAPVTRECWEKNFGFLREVLELRD